MSESEAGKKKLLGISIVGKNPDLWSKLRSRFLNICESVLDLQMDERNQSSVRDELGSFKGKTLDFAKAKLDRPVIENLEIRARIEKLYAEKVKTLAEARKSNAEARIAEVNAGMAEYLWKVNQTRFALIAMKGLMVGEANEEMIVYSNSMDGLMDILNQIKSDMENILHS
jgi:hypothetical protein